MTLNLLHDLSKSLFDPETKILLLPNDQRKIVCLKLRLLGHEIVLQYPLVQQFEAKTQSHSYLEPPAQITPALLAVLLPC